MPVFRLFTIITISIFCFQNVHAQLYREATDNLPLSGATKQSMDVRAADLDKDGDLDIVLANEFQANTILFNEGPGKFVTGAAGNLPQLVHDSEDVAIADFNKDGHLDLVFCSEDDIRFGTTNVHEYYWGDGTGKFTAAPFQLIDFEANAVITADINKDGFPDLLFGNNGQNFILINQGDGSFTLESDRLPAINRVTQDLVLADIDGDDDEDLFAANENGNVLYLNDGNGTFSDVSAGRLPQGIRMESRKATFGDVDGDQDPDLFISNVDFTPAGDVRQNRLYLNDGNGFFSDQSNTHLPFDSDHTIDALFEDMDFDGDLDLFVCNVFGSPLKVYKNDGRGYFEDHTTDFLGANYFLDALGVFAADFDGDQLRDFYVCNRNTPNNNRPDLLLLRNPVQTSTTENPDLVELLCHPNPVMDILHVQGKLRRPKGSLEVALIDSTGQMRELIYNGKVSDGTIQLSWRRPNNIAAGAYYLEIKIDKRIAATKELILR